MSDEATRGGHVRSTPEGGPLDVGAPAQEPGAGQVRTTPEAGPLPEQEPMAPPTWREQMRGPIPGLEGAASPGGAAQPGAAATGDPTRPGQGATGTPGAGQATTAEREATRGGEERKRPLYTGKPVSDVPWGAVLKLAKPLLSLAEKALIVTIDLMGQGLTGAARYLEKQRQERQRRG